MGEGAGKIAGPGYAAYFMAIARRAALPDREELLFRSNSENDDENRWIKR